MLTIKVLLTLATVASQPQVVEVRDFLRTLSTEIGVPVTTTPALERQQIFVERAGASPKVTLKAVATALHARVIQSEQGIEIRRTDEDLKDLRQARTADRLGWLKRRLRTVDEYRKRRAGAITPEGVVQELERQRQALDDLFSGKRQRLEPVGAASLLPASVLVEQLAQRIGLEVLAALPSGPSHVYETNPVSTAKALPKCDDLLKAYAAAMKRFRNAEIPKPAREAAQRTGQTDVFVGWSSDEDAPERLRLQVTALENVVSLRLEGFDRDGRRVLTSSLFAHPVEQLDNGPTILREAVPKNNAHWVSLSPEALEAVGFSSREGLDKLPDWFIHPDKQEPMNLFVREVIAGLAEETKERCTVVQVPDSFWSSVLSCVQNKRVSIDALKTMMTMWTPFECKQEATYVVWRPRDPEIVEKRQADRKVLARFVQRIQADGIRDVRPIACLLHDASPAMGTLPDAWSFPVRVAAVRSWVSQGNLNPGLYRLIGGIPDAQWKRLLNGATMTAAELGITAELRQLFADDGAISVQGDGAFPDIFRHPNELYPRGDIESTPIRVDRSQTPVVRAWYGKDGKEEKSPWIDEEMFGQSLIGGGARYIPIRGKPVLFDTRATYAENHASLHFRRGVREATTMTIGLPRRLWIRVECPGWSSPTTKELRFGDLPATYREQLWQKYLEAGQEALRRLNEAAQGGSDSRGTTSGTPPP
jgi:hypothetical protein